MPVIPCSHVTETLLIVRPSDMDADRNVNNAVYFEYFHQSRLEHLTLLNSVTDRPGRVMPPLQPG